MKVGDDKISRKYVVGKDNSATPTLRIPHRRVLEFKPTANSANTNSSSTNIPVRNNKNSSHELQIPHEYHLSRPRTFSQNTPIQPANRPSRERIGAANVIREQIKRIPDTNKPIVEQAIANYQKRPLTKDEALAISQNFTSHSAAEAIAKKRAIAEAQKRYHEAWRGYYQKFYEQYYAAEMARREQELQQQFAKMKPSELNNNFSRNFLGAAAGTAAANLHDKGTIEGEENARISEMNQLRYDILSRVKKSAKKVKKSRHFIPAIAAIVVILAICFIQFNGVIFANVANFVSPGSTSGQDIIVGTGLNQAVSKSPQVIIPKINVQAPVQYGLTDLSESAAQTALENGPIHYPVEGATAVPGQRGNIVVLGHSSADWFEPGNYKFIFVQLDRLNAGDLFYLDYQGVRYTYRVDRTEIIAPTQIGALNLGTDKPYATLVTCDPPGTATNRLLVIGEQINPDPTSSNEVQTTSTSETANQITGTPPTLLEKIFGAQ